MQGIENDRKKQKWKWIYDNATYESNIFNDNGTRSKEIALINERNQLEVMRLAHPYKYDNYWSCGKSFYHIYDLKEPTYVSLLNHIASSCTKDRHGRLVEWEITPSGLTKYSQVQLFKCVNGKLVSQPSAGGVSVLKFFRRN